MATKLTRTKLIKEIDKLVSMRVRYGSATRDAEGTFWCRCVSCGKKIPLSKTDAGHFVARGCLPLRFDMVNVNPEGIKCNRFSPDHLVGYSNWLIKNRGMKEFQRLVKTKQDWKNGKIKPFKMDELKKIYNENLKEVRKIEKKWNIKLIPANRKEL